MRKKLSDSADSPGKRLKALLREKHITHQVLADAIGYADANNVSMIVCGDRNLPKDKAVRAGEFLGVLPEYLLGLSDFRTEDERKKINLGKAIQDLECNDIVALREYMKALGYYIEIKEQSEFDLYSKTGDYICGFTDSEFNDLSEDVFDYIKMKLLKKQGSF